MITMSIKRDRDIMVKPECKDWLNNLEAGIQ